MKRIISRGLVVSIALLALTTPALTSSTGGWAQPINLSDWFMAGEGMWVKMGADGTQFVFWMAADLNTGQAAIWARARSPGGEWGAAENVTGWLVSPMLLIPTYWNTEVGPDGTAWAVWTTLDASQPAGTLRVMAARKIQGGTWQSEPLSGWETMVRSADLDIGPDGDLAAVWVPCTVSTPSHQGPCAMNVRRRAASAAAWESTLSLAGSSGMGIRSAHALVGPDGLTVVTWAEANPSDSSQWGVMSRAHVPALNAWEGTSTIVSGWHEPPSSSGWQAQPVMSADGTVVTAWTAKTSPGSAQDAQYSSTRAASTDTWSTPPTQISADYATSGLSVPLLLMRAGVSVATWETTNASGDLAVFANIRTPGSVWGTEERLSDWLFDVSLSDLDVWPADGTAMVLWEVEDSSRASTADEGLFWSARHTSAWGDGGQGQLGNWYGFINGAALALGDDGSGTVIWTVTDENQPANQQGGVLAAKWPSGGPWGAVEILADTLKLAATWREGLAVGEGGEPVAAAYLVQRDVAVTTPSMAIFYSEIPSWELYLPLVLK